MKEKEILRPLDSEGSSPRTVPLLSSSMDSHKVNGSVLASTDGLSRLIPPTAILKNLPPPVLPSVDHSRDFNDPTKVLQTYKKRQSCSIAIANLVTLASSCFEVVLPLLLGHYVDIANQRATLSEAEYDDKRTTLLMWAGIAGAVTVFAELIAGALWRSISSKLAKQLRYDLYYCYFQKCLRVQAPSEINKSESLKLFDMQSLREDVDTLTKYLCRDQPRKLRLSVTVLACLVLAFWTSWQLSLVMLAGCFAYLLAGLCRQRVESKSEKRQQRINDQLRDLVKQSYQTQKSVFNELTNQYREWNDQLHRHEPVMGPAVWQAIGLCFAISTVGSLAYYEERLFDGSAQLGLDKLIIWTAYAVLLFVTGEKLSQKDLHESKGRCQEAEGRLFAAS